MDITNVSGSKRTLYFGERKPLANGATGTFPDDIDQLVAALEQQATGDVRVDKFPAFLSYTQPNAVKAHKPVVFDTLVNTDAITVNGVVFTFKTTATVDLLDIDLTAYNTTAAAVGRLKTLVNAHPDLLKVVKVRDVVQIGATSKVVAIFEQVGATALAISDDDTTVVQGTAVAAFNPRAQRVFIKEITADAVEQPIYTGLETIVSYQIQIRTSDIFKAYVGTVRVSGGTLLLDDDGAVDVAAADKIVVVAYGYPYYTA